MPDPLLSSPLPWERLATPLESASDALARLDERLRLSPLREGFLARAHFQDACAALWRAGELVHLEDLVLHDAGMDVRAPTHELVRAHAVLSARRRLAAASPAESVTQGLVEQLRGALQPQALETRSGERDDDDDGGSDDPARSDEAGAYAEIDALLARTARTIDAARQPPVPADRASADLHDLVYQGDRDEKTRLASWLAANERAATLPPVLGAALALEAWRMEAPLQHGDWLGPLLSAHLLRTRGKTRSHLAALHWGQRFAPPRPVKVTDPLARLLFAIGVIEASASQGLKELGRLTIASELMARKCAGRRIHSRMPALADLFLSLPIVSVPLAARKLGVSQQAATTMIAEFSNLTREMTGRGRYRAWGVGYSA